MNSPLSPDIVGRHLLGVRFDALTFADFKKYVEQILRGSAQRLMFTPNPEMLVKARTDSYFKRVLNQSDLNLCDGRGTELALAYQTSTSRIERIPGSDAVLEICRQAEQLQQTIFLLGSGKSSTLRTAQNNLNQRFPNLLIVGTDPGPELHEDEQGRLVEPDATREVIEKIAAAKPDILFVAFGMGKQEKWIHVHISELPSVKLAMGVGGTFEFVAGEIPRAPQWMRTVGLEWLYRLYQEPQRLGRIWRATMVFSWLVAKEQFESGTRAGS
jgi:N-acetylglucosaminyldiphosphoundecaprenol N-acetyl-beta-D-mannosaminyltransferase